MHTQAQLNLKPLDRFSRNIDALQAFDHMLSATLEQGDDIAFVAGGIHYLLSNISTEFSDLYEAFYQESRKASAPPADALTMAIREEFEAVRRRFLAEQLLKNRFPRHIAPALGMGEDELNAILAEIPLSFVQSVAAETRRHADDGFVVPARLKLSPETSLEARAQRGDEYAAQMDFVAEKLQAETSVEDIAEAMDVSHDAVRDMVAALSEKVTAEQRKAKTKIERIRSQLEGAGEVKPTGEEREKIA